MRRFKKPARDQMLLFAHVNLNTIAPIGSAVRIVDEMVEVLDTSEIENEYDLESIVGRNPIHPKTIIKVALYALHNCRFSLRKMEIDTKDNLAYRWLTGNEAIDHSTIGKFLVQFRYYIEDIFTQTVIISTAKELLDFEVLAIDTVKIRANASHKQDKNLNGIEKEEKKVRSRIKDLLDGVEKEANEIKEFDALKRRAAKLSLSK
jgi:transposase